MVSKPTEQRKRPPTTEQVIKALKAHGGFYAGAATALGLTKGRISQICKANPKVQQALAEIHEETLDLAEGKLIAAIHAGEPWAIRYYLDCKGRSRGYGKTFELTGKNGEQPTLKIEIVKFANNQDTA